MRSKEIEQIELVVATGDLSVALEHTPCAGFWGSRDEKRALSLAQSWLAQQLRSRAFLVSGYRQGVYQAFSHYSWVLVPFYVFLLVQC
jgi:hypothetical protein